MAKLSEKRPDRRPAKTQSALEHALFSLLQTNNWDEVGIQMICDEANIARSTFYAHFDSKIDLLDRLIAEQLSAFKKEQDGDVNELLNWLIDHITQSRKLFQKLVTSKSGQVVIDRFRQAVTKEMSKMRLPNGLAISETTAAFVVGGTFETLMVWAKTWKSGAVPELHQNILKLSSRCLAA